jgi:hypothetical protein
MFGARGKYLRFFELTIPEQLHADWHRCFVFHRLSLSAIESGLGSPVWLADHRISAVATSSVDRSTVDVDRGEMAFHLFDFDGTYDEIVAGPSTVREKLELLSSRLGAAVFPPYLRAFILRTSPNPDRAIALHGATSIKGYGDEGVDKVRVERRRGFIGTNQLERNRFPDAVHHLKVFYNEQGKGRLFYKFAGSIQFIRSLRS